MSRDVRTAIRFALAPTAALLVIVAFAPGRLPLAIRIYALVVCAIVLALALAALHRSYPTAGPLRPTTRRREPLARPTVLARLENEAVLGIGNEFDLHRRLAPRLRRLADDLLAARRGLSLEATPDEARRVLGTKTWELVRSDRPPPTDRLARGISPDALAHAVESLERI